MPNIKLEVANAIDVSTWGIPDTEKAFSSLVKMAVNECLSGILEDDDLWIGIHDDGSMEISIPFDWEQDDCTIRFSFEAVVDDFIERQEEEKDFEKLHELKSMLELCVQKIEKAIPRARAEREYRIGTKRFPMGKKFTTAEILAMGRPEPNKPKSKNAHWNAPGSKHARLLMSIFGVSNEWTVRQIRAIFIAAKMGTENDDPVASKLFCSGYADKREEKGKETVYWLNWPIALDEK